MEKLNLAVTLNTQRCDKKGRYAVRIRSCINRKVCYYKTGYNVLKTEFKNGIIINHANRDYYNADLRKQMADIERGFIEGSLNMPGKKISFYKYCEQKIKSSKKRLATGTHKHWESYLKKLKRFRSSAQFSDITPRFMREYEDYCLNLGNKPTTTWGSLKFVRTMINAAIEDKVITSNPAHGYRAKSYVNPERHFLTESEIKMIENFAETTGSDKLAKVANWFLFACYSGLRYDDVQKFTLNKIMNNRIVLRTRKSKSDVTIKIHPKLKGAIERFSWPVITNQKMNDYLKIIADACGIEKTVTFHVSRHTAAVYFLTQGGSMEALSKFLGHSNIRITSIYGKITDEKLDSEVDKVWGK